MAKRPGQAVYANVTVSKPSDGTPTPGDFVALDANGQLTTMAGDGTSNAVGVLTDQAPADGGDAGEQQPFHIGGVVIANVPADTAAGAQVANDKYDTLSAEGEPFKQHETSDASLPEGTGAVNLG